MKASVKQGNAGKPVAVITVEGSLIVKTAIRFLIDKGYPCQIIEEDNTTRLISKDLEYWTKDPGATPVYEGDTVTLEF